MSQPHTAIESHNTVQKIWVELPEEEIKLRGYIHWPHGMSEKSPVADDRTCVIVGHPHPKLGGDTNNNVVGCVVNSLANGYFYKHKDGRSFNLLDDDVQEYNPLSEDIAVHHHVPTAIHNDLISQGHLLREALSTQYITLTVNTRGVGQSTGSSTWFGGEEVADITAVVKYAVDPQGPIKAKRIYLVGYSFSACASGSALEHLCQDAAVAAALRGVCLVSYPNGFMARFILGHHAEPLRRGARHLHAHGIPLLMVTGDADEMTTPAQLGAVFESLPAEDKRFLCVPGASHFWYGEEHTVAKLIDTFIADCERRVWLTRTTGDTSVGSVDDAAVTEAKEASGAATASNAKTKKEKTTTTTAVASKKVVALPPYQESYLRSWGRDMNMWVWLVVLMLMVLRFGNFGEEPTFSRSEL